MSKVSPNPLDMHRNYAWVELTKGEALKLTSRTNVDLPPADTERWVARRKAAVLAAVPSSAISLEEAWRRYELSEEEFLTWERGIGTH